MSDRDDIRGAFVELDINRLDKDELIMLGMKQALEKYIYGFRAQASELQHEGTASVMREMCDIMEVDLQQITVELTRSALRHKSGTMQEVPKGRRN